MSARLKEVFVHSDGSLQREPEDRDVTRLARHMKGEPLLPWLDEIEHALDHGRLWVRIVGLVGHRYWVCRRNGRTRTWKREPHRFEIPIKAGFKAYITIDDGSSVRFVSSPIEHRLNAEYIISATDPSTTKRSGGKP